MTAPAPLAFDQLDPDLLVWGVAILFDLGVYQVIAQRTREDAEIAAGSTNVYATEPDDAATVVYHHPDSGWTCPVTGRTFRTL
jgi:hypothetical protein